MINKSLVKQRFKKSLPTYDDNAVIQKITAKKLVEMLPKKEYENILEPGCVTGILTKELADSVKYKKYTANDIIGESEKYVKKIVPDCDFLKGDIENCRLNENYDLIISNACLQWCCDFENTVKRLYHCLNKGGVLAFSVFGKDNMREISEIFDVNIPEIPVKSLKNEYRNITVQEEEIRLEFNSLTEILTHIKLTGVNAIKSFTLTKTKLKEYEELYASRFSSSGKLYLTYNPEYVVILNQ